MSDKIIIIDFDDSFTYNIANILYPHENSLKVISHSEFFQKERKFYHRTGVILGPGPGHPDQYLNYFSSIKKLLNDDQVYLMGICLGHQLLARTEGYEVKSSELQLHGQSVDFHFKGLALKVQRYNSLSVYINGKETNLREFPHGISYQFHPESIGTDDNLVFFEELLKFIKA